VDDVEVDFGETTGPFERLSGVQGSPAPLLEGEPDLTEAFRAARIASCRIDQDCAPNTLTLGGVFPHEDADVDAAGSYRFDALDRHVRAARAAGAGVLWQASYDVGQSDAWVGFNLGGRPPENLVRWGRVVTKCLEHFNGDFASGLGGAVGHVEFLNEPDGLGGFHGPHAGRLERAFVTFLDVVARFNQAHPASAVQAVGPGVPLSWAEWADYEPRFAALLRAVKGWGRTLPVFSFHTYGADVSPRGNQRLAVALRALLDRNGFPDTALWNTEWQAGDFLRQHVGVDADKVARATPDELRAYAAGFATYALACKLRWQGVVRGSYYYRANARVFPPGYRPPLPAVGLARFFGTDGRPGPLAQQEAVLARVAEATSLRCATRFDDDGLLAVQALRSQDGRAVSVVAANLSLRPRTLRLRPRGTTGPMTGTRLTLDGRGLTESAVDAADDVALAPLASAWLRVGAA